MFVETFANKYASRLSLEHLASWFCHRQVCKQRPHWKRKLAAWSGFEFFTSTVLQPSSQCVSLCVVEALKISLRWRHNGPVSVSNHQPHDCLLNRLFRRRSKKTSKLRVTGLCTGNSPGTGEFPAQMASYAENVSIWWRHHVSIISWRASWYCLGVIVISWLSAYLHDKIVLVCCSKSNKLLVHSLPHDPTLYAS